MQNIVMFIIGCVIFVTYAGFLLWIISSQSKKQRNENYPYIDDVDSDGASDFTRFGNPDQKNS